MTCVHLQQLYQLCQLNHLKISSSDLVHLVCEKCGKTEVCPSMLSEEYEARRRREEQVSNVDAPGAR